MREGKDFVLLPDPVDDQAYAVGIMDGPYAGIRYKYDTISISEQPDDTAQINFRHTIIENPDGERLDEKFDEHIGQILHAILCDAIDNNTIEYKEQNGHRSGNSDPSESGQ